MQIRIRRDLLDRGRRAPRAGFTFIEVCISMSLLVIVLAALSWAIHGMRGLAESGQERSSLQTSAQQGLLEIMEDLARSGIVEVGDTRFPLVFERGDPGDDFPEHVHQPAVENDEEGEPGFGLDREILFLLPRDDDNDREPDLDEDGELIWGEDVHSYVLVTRGDGTNYLERRVNGAEPRIVARFVERVRFDDAASSLYEIPLGSLRVRLFMRKLDAFGTVQRYFTEAVVALKNGQ